MPAKDPGGGPVPRTELDPRYGDPRAEPLPWPRAVELLDRAEVFWLTTVRPEGRPHVTPLLALWWDGALYFCTGAGERKAVNLAHNPEVVLTTGTNALRAGYDLVVEGTAVRVTDGGRLTALAGAWEAKYGPDWHVDVRDGAFVGLAGNTAAVFAVYPRTAFGFGKAPYSQTRWRFRPVRTD
ncbi:pyridoxamine 5'-phosphate oxidase family protein [Streptomyces corynorhini]|uniref:Pyridoxamine 5'-phosphate oxidase family protein n=1 Tax=Streptomyces corynorhini TaxID=2282652 RepID=A0A370B7Q7_9ACTN|nr:pyridoxamine 5'-phosphate oxidase family protein [Streptomyces corynorhini]RDG35776.1 pyridoxamine 5'-phosphate oxidase family protein [Streptomyces corynorhini]